MRAARYTGGMTQTLAPPPEKVESARGSRRPAGEPSLQEIDRRLNADVGREYAGGRFIRKSVSDRSSYLAGELVTELNLSARQPDGKRLARVYPADQIYRCWPDEPRHSRRPDASAIQFDRWAAFKAAANKEDPGEMHIVPDLAVEVLSPGDKSGEVESKLLDYERAGFPLVWVFHTAVRQVEVRQERAPIVRLRDDDTLTLPDLLPAFRLRVGDLFDAAEAGA